MIVLTIGRDPREIDELDQNATVAAGRESCGIRKGGHCFTSHKSCGSIVRSRHIFASRSRPISFFRSLRVVNSSPKYKRPWLPAPGSWSTGGVEVANPMSVYPEYKAQRTLFMPDPGKLEGFTVEISTDKGVKGYGSGGIGGGQVVTGHLTKLLIGEDPFNIERIWDILFRSTMYYGQGGVVPNAISGVDLALWDLVGNALGMPVYKLLGGETKSRIPTY